MILILNSCGILFVELNTSSGNLPTTPPLCQPAQNLVMSSPGVGGDGSVTLTLADTQSMLSAGLDAVTLNITSQVCVISLICSILFLTFAKFIKLGKNIKIIVG